MKNLEKIVKDISLWLDDDCSFKMHQCSKERIKHWPFDDFYEQSNCFEIIVIRNNKLHRLTPVKRIKENYYIAFKSKYGINWSRLNLDSIAAEISSSVSEHCLWQYVSNGIELPDFNLHAYKKS